MTTPVASPLVYDIRAVARQVWSGAWTDEPNGIVRTLPDSSRFSVRVGGLLGRSFIWVSGIYRPDPAHSSHACTFHRELSKHDTTDPAAWLRRSIEEARAAADRWGGAGARSTPRTLPGGGRPAQHLEGLAGRCCTLGRRLTQSLTRTRQRRRSGCDGSLTGWGSSQLGARV